MQYTEGTKSDPKRHLKDITETYSRNPDIPAKEDVWKRIFHIDENTIELLYHYGYNFVTNDTRFYVKPNLAETGGKILFYEDKTSGYIVSFRIWQALIDIIIYPVLLVFKVQQTLIADG